MKKILFILMIVAATACYSQDSAKIVLNNVVLKAKDLAWIKVYLEKSNRNEALDSIINRVYRTTNPGNNNDVTVSGIERRVWRDVLYMLSGQSVALLNEVYKRVHDALLLINDVWMNDKISRDEGAAKLSNYDPIVDLGKKLAKKEID
jgi:hypothetical protein